MEIVLPLIILISVSAKLVRTDRIATFKEYKIIDPPDKTPNTDMEFYLSTMEKLDKLISEADEIRDMHRELMKTAFGLTMDTTAATTTAAETAKSAPIQLASKVGAIRKATAGWVREPRDNLE